MDYNILQYGALSDGVTVNTASIQKAIDACAKTGGRVIVPAGVFVTGTLYLKSNVELHLSHGAKLLASPNLEDYNEEDAYPQNFRSDMEGWNGKHLILCLECENVAITGSGTIDGNAPVFFDDICYTQDNYPYDWLEWLKFGYPWMDGLIYQRDKVNLRPGQMICFIESKNIHVTDVTLMNATCWTCFFHGCDNVIVRGVRVDNNLCHVNTDGLDFDCCRFVTVSDCIISTGDDAFALRSNPRKLKNKDRMLEHVTITNCVLNSSSSSFRIGVGNSTIRHIRVSNISVLSAGVCINFFPEWPGCSTPLEDISFTGISADHVGRMIALDTVRTPVKNLVLKEIYANAMSAVMMAGKTEDAAKNILLENIVISAIDDDRQIDPSRPLHNDLRTNAFVKLYGIKNMKLKNCVFHASDAQLRQWDTLFDAQKCENLYISEE